jgi:hypothetical protein
MYDIRPMKVRIRDDMKVPRGLEATCYTRGRKKKKFTKTKKLHLGNFTQRAKVIEFLIDVQFQINLLVAIFFRENYV